MTGTILSYYLAFLFKAGTPAAPAPTIKAPAKTAEPTPVLVVEAESRDGRRIGTISQKIGADVRIMTAGTVVASATTADEVVDEVQKFYKDINQVSAKFRQTVTNPTFGKETKNDGKLWIKKPGKMRWDYYGKKKKGGKTKVAKTVISNGKYLYVVEHTNKQVIEKNLDENTLPVAVTFLYGKGDLKKDFTAELDTSKKYGGKNDIVLKLSPKVQSAQYKILYLVVDKDAFRVKESVLVDSAGGVNHFRFYEPDFDAEVKTSYFVFNKKSVPDYRITTDADDAAKKDGE